MTQPDVRRLSWEILGEVDRGGDMDELCMLAYARLDDVRDRALLTELVRGVQTWRGRYDHLIDHYAKAPQRIRHGVRNALRLGLHQLLALDRIPDHAAVNETVNLVRRTAGRPQSGFVNGLLQTLLRGAAGQAAERLDVLRSHFPDPGRDPVAYLAGWFSHPEWLVRRWHERYGFTDTAALLLHNNTPPPVDLHVLATGDLERHLAELCAAGHDVEHLPGTRCIRFRTRPFHENLQKILDAGSDLMVQDVSVQRATDWLATGAEGNLYDMCAAPGGKTLQLQALLPHGTLIVAADRSASRIVRLRENCARVAAEPVATICADGLRTPFADGRFAMVLLDGPCSGTGVMRRHPEGRWRLRAETLERNTERLAELAVEARRLLAPRGRLLYATCSLEPEENQDVLTRLAATASDLTVDPDTTGRAERSWLPWRDGGDGFYAARLRRKG